MLFEENKDSANNPDWEGYDDEWKHVHDWRTYITNEVRERWAAIDLEARCIVINIAQSCADEEHWN